MGIFRGLGVVNDGLVFGFDTGYPISDNAVANRFNQGEPTVNLITNSGTSNTGWVGYGWTGSQAISSDYSNTYEFTATNGWHNRTFDTGVTSGGTIYVNFEYKLKQQQTTQNQLFVLNGTHLGSYTNYIGAGSMSFEWKTFSGSFTANTNSSKIAIGPRGADGSGLTDIVYIRNLQVESKAHATPFVNGTRSDTASLIDLKRTASIDVGDVSFDSNAQPTFDGTDDFLTVPSYSGFTVDTRTVEIIFKMNGSYSNFSPLAVYANGSSSSNRIWLGLQSSKFKMHGWGTVDPSGTTTIAADTWYVCTFSYNKSTQAMKMYTNGVLESTTTNTQGGVTAVSGMNWYLATIPGGWQSVTYSDVDIPSFKIYDRILSDAEVAQNFNSYKNRFNI